MTTRRGWTAALLVLGLCLNAQAQQGTAPDRDTTRQAEQVSLTGTVQAIELQDRGGVGQGIHLRLRTEEGRDLDVHLGPQVAVGDMIQGLMVGQQVTAEAFRDDQLPEGQYVARSLAWDGWEVVLRDENLRPAWAGQRPGQGQEGRRMMRGRGMGPGRMGGPAPEGDRPMHQQMQDWLEQMQEASSRLDGLVQAMNEAEGEAKVQAIADVVNELADQHQAMMQRHQQMMQRMMERGPGRGMGPGMMREGPPTQPRDQDATGQRDEAR